MFFRLTAIQSAYRSPKSVTSTPTFWHLDRLSALGGHNVVRKRLLTNRVHMVAVPLHGRPKAILQTDLRSPSDIGEF